MIKKYIRKEIEKYLSTKSGYLADDNGVSFYGVEFNRKYGNRYIQFNDLTKCEKCGCLLYKICATKGKSIIKEKSDYSGSVRFKLPTGKKEYIYTPYYCKTHKPKEKK